jgi:hypothetical protein
MKGYHEEGKLRTLTRLTVFILIGLAITGCGQPQAQCNGNYSKLMPQGWTFVSQTALDTDGNKQLQCIVLYRFDIMKDGRKITPVGGVVYRQDHGRPRWIYPHPLTLPDNFYLGQYKTTARVADVLSGSEGPELIVEDTNTDGNIIQASIFSWRDNKKAQLDTDPSSNPELMSYKPLGLLLGDSGVKVERDKVTIWKQRAGTRSQLADRLVYVPRDKKNYYKQDSNELVDVAEADIVTLVGADDPTSSPYPEKTVLAFYQNVREDAKLDGLMTREALASLKGGQLPYGCPVGRDQLDRVLVQSVDWSRGTPTQPQVVVGGKCKLKDGSFRDMTSTAWQLEQLEGKWRIKGATAQ